MAFSSQSKNRAWLNQSFVNVEGYRTAKCEGCGKNLRWDYEGKEVEGGWVACYRIPKEQGGSSKWQNCVILCITTPSCYLGNQAP